ncbi:MAG: hypothetical protein H0X08_09410, partial [Blastocatellia bacterium]|nr:hypothetical protein [Blastocatellia bacterium]
DLDGVGYRMRVSSFFTRTFVKAAEFAVSYTDIRVVKMPVDVVIGRQPVPLAADMIGQFADRVEIGRVEKREAFVEGQPFAVFDLIADVPQFLVERKVHIARAKILTEQEP